MHPFPDVPRNRTPVVLLQMRRCRPRRLRALHIQSLVTAQAFDGHFPQSPILFQPLVSGHQYNNLLDLVLQEQECLLHVSLFSFFGEVLLQYQYLLLEFLLFLVEGLLVDLPLYFLIHLMDLLFYLTPQDLHQLLFRMFLLLFFDQCPDFSHLLRLLFYFTAIDVVLLLQHHLPTSICLQFLFHLNHLIHQPAPPLHQHLVYSLLFLPHLAKLFTRLQERLALAHTHYFVDALELLLLADALFDFLHFGGELGPVDGCVGAEPLGLMAAPGDVEAADLPGGGVGAGGVDEGVHLEQHHLELVFKFGVEAFEIFPHLFDIVSQFLEICCILCFPRLPAVFEAVHYCLHSLPALVHPLHTLCLLFESSLCVCADLADLACQLGYLRPMQYQICPNRLLHLLSVQVNPGFSHLQGVLNRLLDGGKHPFEDGDLGGVGGKLFEDGVEHGHEPVGVDGDLEETTVEAGRILFHSISVHTEVIIIMEQVEGSVPALPLIGWAMKLEYTIICGRTARR